MEYETTKSCFVGLARHLDEEWIGSLEGKAGILSPTAPNINPLHDCGSFPFAVP
jgi:hypothetical protein